MLSGTVWASKGERYSCCDFEIHSEFEPRDPSCVDSCRIGLESNTMSRGQSKILEIPIVACENARALEATLHSVRAGVSLASLYCPRRTLEILFYICLLLVQLDFFLKGNIYPRWLEKQQELQVLQSQLGLLLVLFQGMFQARGIALFCCLLF